VQMTDGLMFVHRAGMRALREKTPTTKHHNK
jgi:hypothetical protein